MIGLEKVNRGDLGILAPRLTSRSTRSVKTARAPRKPSIRARFVRFRPIIMTTMAALMGTLPIAMGFGAGAESRRPLGLAVVGGLIFSQTLTLYITRFTTSISTSLARA